MNDKNLNPVRTESEARALGRIGGKASAASKRNKKAMQEIWQIIYYMPIGEGELSEIEEIRSIAQLRGANITVGQAMVLALAKKAMKGDVRAFEVLSKLTESGRRAEEITAEKAALELEKLKIELDAYRRYEAKNSTAIQIVDDIPC